METLQNDLQEAVLEDNSKFKDEIVEWDKEQQRKISGDNKNITGTEVKPSHPSTDTSKLGIIQLLRSATITFTCCFFIYIKKFAILFLTR